MGGALAINGGQLLLARLMGTSADESCEMAHSARALLGGAVAAGGVLRGAKNLAFGGYNKYGRFRTGMLPGAARIGNTAGNFFGGQRYAGSRGASIMHTLGRYGHSNGNPNFGLRQGKGESSAAGGTASTGGSAASAVEQAMSGNPVNNAAAARNMSANNRRQHRSSPRRRRRAGQRRREHKTMITTQDC